jgi:outer membrane protein assembly factor BamB
MATPTPIDPSVWRTAGGDNSRHGRFGGVTWPVRGPAGHSKALGAVQASVVFDAAGNAFVADMAGGVQSFSPTGNRRWQVTVGGGVSATPVLDAADTLLFVGTHLGDVLALDTATGATRWSRPIPSRKDPRILSDFLHLEERNLVVFGSWSGRFLALDGVTGEPHFDWDAGISPRSAASADRAGNLYTVRAVAGRGIEFVQVRREGGGQETILHREPEDSRGASRALVACAPVLDESRGVAYVVANHERAGHLLAWSLASGRVLWKRELGAAVQATPTVLTSGAVVVADLAGNVEAFDPEGAPRFRTPLRCDYLLAGGVAPAEDRFVLGDPLGAVHELDARGTPSLVFQAPRSIQGRPSFDPSGRLHIPCTDGSVYRFATTPKTG